VSSVAPPESIMRRRCTRAGSMPTMMKAAVRPSWAKVKLTITQHGVGRRLGELSVAVDDHVRDIS
jgi:hypothetical protein